MPPGSAPQARKACRQFVGAAKRAGGTDNIIVIVTRRRDPVPNTVAAEEAVVLTARRGHGHPPNLAPAGPIRGRFSAAFKRKRDPSTDYERPERDQCETTLNTLLAGPILRRVEPRRVCLWLATSRSVRARRDLRAWP